MYFIGRKGGKEREGEGERQARRKGIVIGWGTRKGLQERLLNDLFL